MMHILFLAPRLPLPADTGGKIRTLNVLKQLARRNDVHLVSFSFEKSDGVESCALENTGVHVHLVPVSDTGFLSKGWNVLFNALPLSITKYDVKAMDDAITGLMKEIRFDAVHIDHLHMAHYTRHLNGLPYIIDEHNVEYKILERCADVEKSLFKKLIYTSQASKMRKFEAGKIAACTRYFAVSEDDNTLLCTISQNKTRGIVIPNGVDTEYFQIEQSKGEKLEDAVIFTGSMDWLPNDDAASFFCEQILPHIWEVKSDVKFYIVGKDPSNALKLLAQADERIVLTGRVNDVRDYVKKAKVFVVPLRIGGGTRLKILEALSMQKAVVSTMVGAEGINFQEDVHMAIGNNPKEFANRVLLLLNDDARRTDLGRAGRNMVIEKYDWHIIGDKLNQVYEELTV